VVKGRYFDEYEEMYGITLAKLMPDVGAAFLSAIPDMASYAMRCAILVESGSWNSIRRLFNPTFSVIRDLRRSNDEEA
jgi:hypothetical protein